MLLREARIMLKSCHSPLRSFSAEVKSYGMFSNVICHLLCLFVLFSALFVYFFFWFASFNQLIVRKTYFVQSSKTA